MNKKTKIAYLITGLHTGGAEMVVRDLARGLDESLFDVVVVSILPVGAIGKSMEHEGVRVFSLDVGFKYNPFIIFKLTRLLKEEAPDILHTHLFHADALGRISAKLAKVPKVIATIHNVNIGGFLREVFIRLTRKLSHYDVGVSRAVLKNAVEKKMVDEDMSAVIYNGIDVENFPEKDKAEARRHLGIPEGKKVFVSVGRLVEQKGYDYLIKAVSTLEKGCLFLIVGEGPLKHALETKIKKSGLEEDIILKDRVPYIDEYLQAADFFVMSSLWEGFSIALLEAMASGKVVVVSDVGGNGEVVTDGENGFLVPPGDSKLLKEGLERAINLSDEERERISKSAKETVKERFYVKKMVLQYEKLYENINSK